MSAADQTELRPSLWTGAKQKSSMHAGLAFKFTLAAILAFDVVSVSAVLVMLGGAR